MLVLYKAKPMPLPHCVQFGDGSEAAAMERRREERFPVPVDVELVSCGAAEPAVLQNISHHGVGLLHARPLETGEIVTCRLLDTPVDLPCTYNVEILWQKPAEGGRLFSGGRIVSAEPTTEA